MLGLEITCFPALCNLLSQQLLLFCGATILVLGYFVFFRVANHFFISRKHDKKRSDVDTSGVEGIWTDMDKFPFVLSSFD
jgi:hypothetical protein